MGGPIDDARKQRERAAGQAASGREFVEVDGYRFCCAGPGVRNIVRGRVALGVYEGPLLGVALGEYDLASTPLLVCRRPKGGAPAVWTVDGAAPARVLADAVAGGRSPAAVASAFGTTVAHVADAVRGRSARWCAGHLTLRRPLLELGGGLGVAACRVNRLLARPGEHLVVERDARQVARLRASAQANRAAFVSLHAQVGLDDRAARRGGTPGPPLPLAELLALAAAAEPVELLCSLDGGEVDVLDDEAIAALAACVARMVVVLHPYGWAGGAAAAARLRAAIEAAGFVKLGRRVQTIAFVNPALDGVPVGAPGEDEARASRPKAAAAAAG